MDTNGQNLPKISHQWAKNAKIRTERGKNGQMLLQKRFKPGTVKSARAPRALARGTRALQACNIQLPLQGLKSCQLPPQGLLCAVWAFSSLFNAFWGLNSAENGSKLLEIVQPASSGPSRCVGRASWRVPGVSLSVKRINLRLIVRKKRSGETICLKLHYFYYSVRI